MNLTHTPRQRAAAIARIDERLRAIAAKRAATIAHRDGLLDQKEETAMSVKLGWCLTGHHHGCPYRVGGPSADYPEIVCTCTCHEEAP